MVRLFGFLLQTITPRLLQHQDFKLIFNKIDSKLGTTGVTWAILVYIL